MEENKDYILEHDKKLKDEIKKLKKKIEELKKENKALYDFIGDANHEPAW